MPLMYLESMVDGAMKGVGEQKAAFRYSVWDSILRIGGVVVLLPRFGMKGFLAVILLSSLYTCMANTGRLLFSSGMRHAFRRWLGAPALAAGVSAGVGAFLRETPSGRQAGDAGAAGGAVHRLLRHGGWRGWPPPGLWVWVPKGGARAPPEPGPAEGEKSAKSTRTMKSSGYCWHETSIIQWIPWRSRLSSRWPGNEPAQNERRR